MTFKEQLKIAENNNLSILDLEIADECDCVFEFEYTDDEFEKLCTRIRTAYLKAEEMTVAALVHCVNDLITEEDKSIEQICEMDVYDFILKASWYL